MTKTITSPGPGFPTTPKVSLTVPDDWSTGPTTGVVLTALATQVPGAFRANVVISAGRLATPPRLEALAEGVRQRVAHLDDSHPVLDQMVTVGGRPGHILQFTYRDADAGTLAQNILAIPVEHEGVTDLFEVVGSFGADRIEQDARIVTAVMQSVVITELPAGNRRAL